MGGSLSRDTGAHVTQCTHDFPSPGTSWRARTRESRGEGTPEAGRDPEDPGGAWGKRRRFGGASWGWAQAFLARTPPAPPQGRLHAGAEQPGSQ